MSEKDENERSEQQLTRRNFLKKSGAAMGIGTVALNNSVFQSEKNIKSVEVGQEKRNTVISDSFEDGDLDGYREVSYSDWGPDRRDVSGFEVINESKDGEFGLTQKTVSRILIPQQEIELDPPFEVTFTVNIHDMAGFKFDFFNLELNEGYEAAVKHNFNGYTLDVKKFSDFNKHKKENRNRILDTNFDLNSWEEFKIRWEDNLLEMSYPKLGKSVSLPVDEFDITGFGIVGYHYSGYAVLDNYRIDEIGTRDKSRKKGNVIFKEGFESGTLEDYEVKNINWDSHREGFKLINQARTGEYGLKQQTESRMLIPRNELSIEPPAKIEFYVYIVDMSGYRITLIDKNQIITGQIQLTSNGEVLSLTKRPDIYTKQNSVARRNRNGNYHSQRWEKFEMILEVGQIKLRYPRKGTSVKMVDEDYEVQNIGIAGYNYSGYAVLDDLKIVEYGSETSDTNEETSKQNKNKPTGEIETSLSPKESEINPGEETSLKFSATNLITSEDKATLQLVLDLPSGVSTTDSKQSKIYEIEPGNTTTDEINIKANSPGKHEISGKVVYFFGENKEQSKVTNLGTNIEVTEPETRTENQEPKASENSSDQGSGTSEEENPLPGFTAGVSAAALLSGGWYAKRKLDDEESE